MPLDPVLKSFLDQMAAVPGPKMWEQSPEEGRQAFIALLQLAGPKDVPIGKTETLAANGGAGGARQRRTQTCLSVASLSCHADRRRYGVSTRIRGRLLPREEDARLVLRPLSANGYRHF